MKKPSHTKEDSFAMGRLFLILLDFLYAFKGIGPGSQFKFPQGTFSRSASRP